MPRKGYKSITVDEMTYFLVAEISRKRGKSMSETIRSLTNESVNRINVNRTEVEMFVEGIRMPKKGHKVITIGDATYDALAEVAQKLRKTLPETIKFLINFHSGDLEWSQKCDPFETCPGCPIGDVCWLRKFLLGDEKITRTLVEAVERKLFSKSM